MKLMSNYHHMQVLFFFLSHELFIYYLVLIASRRSKIRVSVTRIDPKSLFLAPYTGYFRDRILFLTVSQSPNVDQLRAKIWGYIMGNENLGPNYLIPQYNLQYECRIGARTLVVLDDVWSLSVLERLILPGCKILVVSRFKFHPVVKATYDVELLTEKDAMSLFCHSAFGQKSMPLHANQNLVKQVQLSNSRPGEIPLYMKE